MATRLRGPPRRVVDRGVRSDRPRTDGIVRLRPMSPVDDTPVKIHGRSYRDREINLRSNRDYPDFPTTDRPRIRVGHRTSFPSNRVSNPIESINMDSNTQDAQNHIELNHDMPVLNTPITQSALIPFNNVDEIPWKASDTTMLHSNRKDTIVDSSSSHLSIERPISPIPVRHISSGRAIPSGSRTPNRKSESINPDSKGLVVSPNRDVKYLETLNTPSPSPVSSHNDYQSIDFKRYSNRVETNRDPDLANRYSHVIVQSPREPKVAICQSLRLPNDTIDTSVNSRTTYGHISSTNLEDLRNPTNTHIELKIKTPSRTQRSEQRLNREQRSEQRLDREQGPEQRPEQRPDREQRLNREQGLRPEQRPEQGPEQGPEQRSERLEQRSQRSERLEQRSERLEQRSQRLEQRSQRLDREQGPEQGHISVSRSSKQTGTPVYRSIQRSIHADWQERSFQSVHRPVDREYAVDQDRSHEVINVGGYRSGFGYRTPNWDGVYQYGDRYASKYSEPVFVPFDTETTQMRQNEINPLPPSNVHYRASTRGVSDRGCMSRRGSSGNGDRYQREPIFIPLTAPSMFYGDAGYRTLVQPPPTVRRDEMNTEPNISSAHRTSNIEPSTADSNTSTAGNMDKETIAKTKAELVRDTLFKKDGYLPLDIRPPSGNNMPNYAEMSGPDQARYRAYFQVMFGHLRSLHPQYAIPNFNLLPLPELHAYYEVYYHHFAIKTTVDQYMLYLSIFWMVSELFMTKILKMKFGGFASNQLKLAKTYERYMFEFVQRYSGVGTAMAPEYKIVCLMATTAIIHLALQTFSKWLGNYTTNMIQDYVNKFMNGETQGGMTELLSSFTAAGSNAGVSDPSALPPIPEGNGVHIGPLNISQLTGMATSFVSNLSGSTQSGRTGRRSRPNSRRTRSRRTAPRFDS
jgi:hypothetical protein